MSPSSRSDPADSGALIGAARPAAPMDANAAAKHQEAIRFLAESWTMQGDERRATLSRAVESERESLRHPLDHPWKGLVAETGARAALLAGDPDAARELLRLGRRGKPDETTKSCLIRLEALAISVRELIRTGHSWAITEPRDNEEEAPDLVAQFDDRRIEFFVDENATSIRNLRSSCQRLELAIPDVPDREELRKHVADWIQPRREVVRESGLVDTYLWAPTPA